MKTSIETILDELFKLDSLLKKREAELRSAIENIISAKPDTEFSPVFYERLREELIERAQNLAEAKNPQNPTSFWQLWFPYGFAAAAFLLGLLPSAYLLLHKPAPVTPALAPLAEVSTAALGELFSPEVVEVQDEAFGADLIAVVPTNQSAMGLGGGGFSEADAKMMVPEGGVAYEFVYEGELPLPSTSTLPVYKRVVSKSAREQFADSLKDFGMGLTDMSTFSNLALQSLSLTESAPYGLILNADFLTEQISLSPDYANWPNPLMSCFGENIAPEASEQCQKENALKIEDIPADDAVITAAKTFLQEHKIELNGYGEPYVNTDWRREYERVAAEQPLSTEQGGILPIPEQLTTIFPLLIEGKPVYEGTRGQYGLNVSYDLRHERVAGVFNLTTRRFEKSEYPVQTDSKALDELLKQGGLYGASAFTAEKKTITLSEPQTAYIRHTEFKDGKMAELFVPALIFPIPPQEDAGTLFQDKVVLPLITGIKINQPEIMPLR